MQHRVIIGASKTGTISLTEARRAARLAKTAKAIKRPAGKRRDSSSFFGLHFGPATAEPKTWGSGTATRKKAAKIVAKPKTRSRKSA